MTITTLFSPVKLGRYQLKHRVVMAPTGRFRCTIEGVPTELVAEYYGQRASPGGLLITEATAIHESAGPYPYVACIFTKEQIEGYKLATEAVHKKGGLFFVQLWHGGRAAASVFMPNGEQIVSASDIPVAGKNRFLEDADYEVPRPLTKSEIKDVIQLYKQAALNAIEAGFDGVELHGANGYLIDQFINSNSNNRTDEYGGSIENRARFALEVVDAVAEAIGEDRTAIRFSPGGSFNGVRDDTVVETWSYLTSQLQKNHPNLAYIHFIERRYDIDADVDSISGDSLEPFRKIWKGTFIASGGFSTAREKAFEYAQQHDVLISFGRAFIANPDLPERLRNNWPLNPYHRPTFYTHDAVGYTDYPFYNAKTQA